MTAGSSTTQRVQSRAKGRCEYCKMHQSLQGATFHLEHIVPRSRGGSSLLNNLAWACPGCNLLKSDHVSVVDPLRQEPVAMFNPRRDRWNDHYQWDGFRLVGQTAIGRAMIAAFDLNHPRRLLIREAENAFGLFAGDPSQATP